MTRQSGHATLGVFVRYLLVGGINAAVGFGFFCLLTRLLGRHLSLQAILLISYLYPVVVGFLGNKFLVFRSQAGWQREHLRFLLVFVLCIAVNYLATVVLVERYGLGSQIAQLLATLLSAFVGFLGNYVFTFRPAESALVDAGQDVQGGGPSPAPGMAMGAEPREHPDRHTDHPATGSR